MYLFGGNKFASIVRWRLSQISITPASSKPVLYCGASFSASGFCLWPCDSGSAGNLLFEASEAFSSGGLLIWKRRRASTPLCTHSGEEIGLHDEDDRTPRRARFFVFVRGRGYPLAESQLHTRDLERECTGGVFITRLGSYARVRLRASGIRNVPYPSLRPLGDDERLSADELAARAAAIRLFSHSFSLSLSLSRSARARWAGGAHIVALPKV